MTGHVTCPPVVKGLNCIVTVKLVSEYHLILCVVAHTEEWGKGAENRNEGLVNSVSPHTSSSNFLAVIKLHVGYGAPPSTGL